MAPVALVTGVTGQVGAYLTELLLEKGYAVHGVRRRTSSQNTGRIADLAAQFGPDRFRLHYGDLTDQAGLSAILEEIRPDEIYNLGAQSHVRVSFEAPKYTADVDALGPLRLLEAMRLLKLGETTRFYQASTSEMFGNAVESPQSETTPFQPRSPYGAAKLYAYWMTVNYREAYGFHASNGILFNHEGPTRGETFLTRKVSRGVAAIEHGKLDRLRVGNLDARRDWGHARDYVDGMWRMLQQDAPDDYVLATGRARSVREFIESAFAVVGRTIEWRGEGLGEVGRDARSGQILVEVDPAFFRPAEVDVLVGDATKARARLGWAPRTSFAELVAEMVAHDLKEYSGALGGAVRAAE